MKTILLVCSLKLGLKIRLNKTKMDNLEKINFKDYFSDLSDDEKLEIRNLFILKYKMAYSTFYSKLNNNSWSELEFEKLEEVTRKNFTR